MDGCIGYVLCMDMYGYELIDWLMKIAAVQCDNNNVKIMRSPSSKNTGIFYGKPTKFEKQKANKQRSIQSICCDLKMQMKYAPCIIGDVQTHDDTQTEQMDLFQSGCGLTDSTVVKIYYVIHPW